MTCIEYLAILAPAINMIKIALDTKLRLGTKFVQSSQRPGQCHLQLTAATNLRWSIAFMVGLECKFFVEYVAE